MPEAPMLERDFQLRVVGLARLLGWRHAHFRPAQTARGWRTAQSGDPGFPDMVLVRPPRVVFVEFKADGAPKPRPDQQAWLDQLAASGVETYVWRPRDWDSVLDILRRREVAA